MLKAKFHI